MAGLRLPLSRGWRSNGQFYGGVFLPAEKERTEDRAIEPLPIPKKLYVPMLQHCGRPAEPCLGIGQVVRCGELIGRSMGSDCPAVHASADGVVRAIATCDTPHHPEVPCVEIDTERAAIPHVASATTAATIDDLIAQVCAAGIVEHDSLGHAGLPVAVRLREASARGCDCLIINAMESDPCVTADWRVLVERTSDVIAGAKRLATLLGVRDVWLAVDASKHRMVSHLEAEQKRDRLDLPERAEAPRTQPSPVPMVQVAPLLNKYPQGHPALLIKAIRRQEIPYGGDDLTVGTLVISVGAIAAIESLLRSGMPMTQRLVTVTGDAAERPGNYTIALGTPIRHVIEHVGLRCSPWTIVVGSPMTGVAIRRLDTVVTKRTTALLLLGEECGGQPSRHAPTALPGACTRCGWCQEDCPVGLDPAALLGAAEERRLDRAAALRMHACIGCGLCSYACPARLPIAESIRALQQEVACPPAPASERRGKKAAKEAAPS